LLSLKVRQFRKFTAFVTIDPTTSEQSTGSPLLTVDPLDSTGTQCLGRIHLRGRASGCHTEPIPSERVSRREWCCRGYVP